MNDKKRAFIKSILQALMAQRVFEEKYDPDNLLRAKYGDEWVKYIE